MSTQTPSVLPLLELRARLLRPLLAATAVLSLLYLTAGAVGVNTTGLYPWDGLGLLTLCALCAWLTRGGSTRVALAAALLLAGISQPIIYASQTFGLDHPINGLFLVGVVLCGLLIGGWFVAAWTAFYALWILLVAFDEAGSAWMTLWPSVVVWWTLLAVTGGAVWLFANSLERAVVAARGQTLALTRTVAALAEDPDMESLLEYVLRALAEQLKIRFASLFMLDEAGETMRLHRAVLEGRVVAPSEVPGPPMPPTPIVQLPVWQEMSTRLQPFVINDVRRDARLRHRERMVAEGIRSVLYVPLLDGPTRPGVRLIGLLAINRTDRQPFGSDEIDLALALMQQLTLAMQITELAKASREGAVLEERNRMAREIHDTLAQGFTGIVVQLETAEDAAEEPAEAARHIRRARELARESLAEARRSVWALRPQALAQRSLIEALRDGVSALTQPAGLAARFDIDSNLPALSADLENDLLRIGLEAVTNAIKYAQAHTISIGLRVVNGGLTLRVADDGRGFTPDTRQDRGGFGLIGMRERARRHGGAVEIESGPTGAAVIVTIPVAEKG